MGLTERHLFENEESELTDQQLEDIVYENKKAYSNGYIKGFHDAKTLAQIVLCKDCRHRDPEDRKCDCGGMPFDTQIHPVPDDWFCPYGERKVDSGNDILEQIRNTNPNNVASKVCDEWLDRMKDRYRFKIESMKNEIKQLEQEIEQEKIKVGIDEYNKRILSILENPPAFVLKGGE